MDQPSIPSSDLSSTLSSVSSSSSSSIPSPQSIPCPFTVIIDTREQKPYTFQNLRANADQQHRPIVVSTIRKSLKTGDYAIDGLPRYAVERKSKEDLFSSVARRKNFEDRLRRFANSYDFGSVVIESEWGDILRYPPVHSRLLTKSLTRTIISWQMEFPTISWNFLPTRDHAEKWVFRQMECYWRRKQQEFAEAKKWVMDGSSDVGDSGDVSDAGKSSDSAGLPVIESAPISDLTI